MADDGLPEISAPLPEGWVPLEMVTVVKCLDEDGEPGLCIRQSGGVSAWEVVGMLQTGLDANRDHLRESYCEEE